MLNVQTPIFAKIFIVLLTLSFAATIVNAQKRAAFIFKNALINDEVWRPPLAASNILAKVLLVKGININQIVEFSGYQKFETEIKELTINEIKKP